MFLRRTVSVLAALLLVLSLSACGPTPTSVTLPCEPARTGNIIGSFHLDDSILGYGGAVNSTYLLTGGSLESGGSNPHKDCMRAFVSFDLTSLPAGAHIQSATLRVYLESCLANPITTLGNVSVEHIYFGTADPFSDIGPTYDGLLFSPQVSGSLSTTVSAGWREINVTAAVKADFSALHTRTQFRLRHTQLFPTSDTTTYENWLGGSSPVNGPELLITYTL